MPNVDLNPYEWEEIKHILNTFVPGYEVWAFGSRVTWTAKAYSDLDIAIITEKPLLLSELARLKEAFDDSTISIKVDVVDWASTSESFRKIIEKKKVLLQEAVTTKAGWKVEKLIDCTRDGNLSYGIVQPGQQDPNGIPIVRVNNFKNGQLQLDDMLRVSSEIESKYRRTRLVGGEVLLTLVGSTGQSAVVPKGMVGGNIARAVAVIRPKPDIGANWINICLQTKEVQRFLDERANTTVQKTLNLADVREIPIPIPPRAVKEKIEAVAMALADKIELNRQINQTLEQIAQTLFKSWFVDFEPVKAKIAAKAAGRDPERAAMCAISGKLEPELDQLPPEQRQQLAATAALFPDELVESELGLIPLGWEVQSIADISKFATEKIGVSALSIENYISTENMLENRGGVCRAASLSTVPTVPRFSKGQVLISNIRPYFKKIWFARFDGGRLNDVLAFNASENDCAEFLYNLLYQDEFFEFMMRTSKGAKMPRGDKDAIAGWKFPSADYSLKSFFSEKVRPYYSIIESLNAEVQHLSLIRDSLLPKLLSGELPVGECDHQIGARS